MSKEFDEQLRGAFPANTDLGVIRSIAGGVSLADDARRNTPWLMNLIGEDHRALLRRAAAMWQFRQDCLAGNLPFKADEIPNTTGSAHLLKISAGDFEAHIVRTESQGAFPKDAPIRQDMSLQNEPDLFRDGKIVPLHEIKKSVERFYAWLSFNADHLGGLTHVCWCMPEADRKRFLGRVNIPPAPDPATKMKFKTEVVERIMDLPPEKQDQRK